MTDLTERMAGKAKEVQAALAAAGLDPHEDLDVLVAMLWLSTGIVTAAVGLAPDSSEKDEVDGAPV